MDFDFPQFFAMDIFQYHLRILLGQWILGGYFVAVLAINVNLRKNTPVAVSTLIICVIFFVIKTIIIIFLYFDEQRKRRLLKHISEYEIIQKAIVENDRIVTEKVRSSFKFIPIALTAAGVPIFANSFASFDSLFHPATDYHLHLENCIRATKEAIKELEGGILTPEYALYLIRAVDVVVLGIYNSGDFVGIFSLLNQSHVDHS